MNQRNPMCYTKLLGKHNLCGCACVSTGASVLRQAIGRLHNIQAPVLREAVGGLQFVGSCFEAS